MIRYWLIIFVAVAHAAFAQDVRDERLQAMELLTKGQDAKFEEVAVRLSERGDIESQILLGRFLMKKERYSEAEKWLKATAARGDAEGQWHLAGLYFTSVPPRNIEGEKWVKASAAQGFDLALDFLENRSYLPKVLNGRVAIDSIVAYQNRIGKRKIDRFSDSQAQCYGQSRNDIVQNSVRVTDTCEHEIGQRYGSSVPESLALKVSQEVVDCSNRELLRLANKSAKELFDCLAKFEYQSSRDLWVGQIRNKIRTRITLPADTPAGIKAVFSVVQLPNGEVISATLRTSSGFEPYDLAAYHAILKASPLPKPRDPADFVRAIELSFIP